MFGRLGTPELLVVLFIALVIFGPKQLPKLGKTLGTTIKSFKDGVDSDEQTDETEQE